MASLRLPILFYSILVDATQAACSCAYAKRLLLVWSAIVSETEARLVSRRAHFRYLCLMIIIEPLPLSLSYLPRLASPRLVSLSCALCLVPAHHTVPASFILLAFTCLHHPRSHSYYCRCASLLSLTYAAAQPLTNNQAYSHRKPLLDATLLLLLLLLTRRLSLPTPHDRSHLLEIVCSRASFAFSLYLSRTPWCAPCGSSRLALDQPHALHLGPTPLAAHKSTLAYCQYKHVYTSNEAEQTAQRDGSWWVASTPRRCRHN